MKEKKLIFEYIKKQVGKGQVSAEWHEAFDGMSTGTARVVIDREAADQLPDDYGVDLQNNGRYYVAKIVGHNGVVLKRLLVDKQTGKVRPLR